MIVCHCEVVRCSDIRAAADRGAATVNAVCGATGAGQNCGGCVFTVKRVLCEHLAEPAPTETVVAEVAS